MPQNPNDPKIPESQITDNHDDDAVIYDLDLEMLEGLKIHKPISSDSLTPNGSEPGMDSEDKELGKALELALLSDQDKREPTSHQFGRFRIKSALGRGAFGEVWRGYDPICDRMVAIKIPIIRTGEHFHAKKFFREAKAASELRHPNIVAVHDTGVLDNRPYIAFEYVNASTMEWRFKDPDAPKPDRRQTVLWIRDLARALGYAHARGIVHRDIKPANVLLDDQGVPKLADFGLARRAVDDDPDDAGRTQEGQRLGTPAYMSPEQARGENAAVGPRSDQFSLGVMLYEMLAGQRPFQGSPDLMMTRIADPDFEPVGLCTLDPSFPRDLEAVCLKTLEKDRAKRYSTCDDLADDLTKWLENREVSARPATTFERMHKWRQRRPREALLATMMVIGLSMCFLGIGAAALIAWNQSRIARQKTEEALTNAEIAEEKTQEAQTNAQRAEANAKQLAESLKITQEQFERAETAQANTNMVLAQTAWETNQIPTFLQSLDRVPPKQQQFEWHYWYNRFHNAGQTLKGHTNYVNNAAFSPAGNRLASASSDKTVKLWDISTGKEIMTLKGHTSGVNSIAFSPAGNRLASASFDKTLKVWDAETGRELHTLKGHTATVNSAAFSPDGKRIASASDDKTLKLWDAETGREMLTLKGPTNFVTSGAALIGLKATLNILHEGHTNPVNSAAFSPDGNRLASASADKTLKLWDAVTGQGILTFSGHTETVWSAAFSPAGNRLASASQDQTVKVWDAVTGKEILTLKGHTAGVRSVAFSPDGNRLVSASDDRTLKVWDAVTGREVITLKGHTAPIWSAAFSPDGNRLVSASDDRTLKLWDLTTDRETPTLKGHTSEVWSAAFSPDGKRLASGSKDFSVKLWDAMTGREMITLKGHFGPVAFVAFSPAGNRLVTASGDRDNRLKVWDIATKRDVLTLKGHTHSVWSAAFSPDGNRLASASEDKTLKLWDAVTGRELLTLKGHTAAVRSAAFSPDGKRLVSASGDRTLKMWDAVTGKNFMTLNGHSGLVYSVVFSPAGNRLASASGDTMVKLWDVNTGQEIRTLKGHTDEVFCVAFSPDGNRLVSASTDKTLKLWDATTGQEVLTLKGHTGAVSSAAFSPAGNRLVSASLDKTLKLWDATTPREILTFKDHKDPVHHPVFRPAGGAAVRLRQAGTRR